MDVPQTESAAQRLARYTPEHLSSDHWSLARKSAVGCVLSARPRGAEDTKGLISRLCHFLAGHAGWDRSAAPELAALLTADAITAHLRRLELNGKSAKTRENHRADLRRLARSLTAPAGASTSAASASSAPSVSRSGRAVPESSTVLLGWLLSGEAPTAAFTAWGQYRGRALTRDSLEPVTKAVLAACAITLDPGTVAVLSAVGALAREEVSPKTWPRSPIDTTSRRAASAPAGLAKPVSRAAALRAAKTALAAAAAPTVAPEPDPELLPAPVRAAIEAYRPAGLSRERWEELGPLCRRLMVGFAPPSANSARTVGSVLAPFLDWAAGRPDRRSTAPLDAVELRVVGLADAYLDQLGSPAASLATYRSVLRRALTSLDPAPPTKIAYQKVAGPYAPAECAAFVRLARNQPSPSRRRELSAIVGLGLGAGLDGGDLRAVAPDSLSTRTLEDGTEVLLVQVSGDRPRLVPVAGMYAPLVREAVALHHSERRGARTPLVGLKPGRRNITSPALTRAVTATDAPVDIAVNRLRATWLVGCLRAGIPLGALMQAAGLRSARTLTDLLEHCPTPDPAEVARLLATIPTPPAETPAAASTPTPATGPGGPS